MLKRLGLIFTSGLFKLCLVALAISGAGWITFGTPDTIKRAAGENKIYDSAETDIVQSVKQETQGDGGRLPLDNPELEQAAKDAFPNKFLSQSGESIIDGFYGWLQGKTEQPEFSVDVSGAKQTFANGIGDYAQRRYDSLPACTLAELQNLTPEVQPLEVSCRIPGLVGSEVRDQVIAEIQNNKDFAGDTAFTPEDLPKDEQGKTITQNLAFAPKLYSLLKTLPWILGVLSLLLATAVLFLSQSKRRGLKSIAVTLFGTGLFLLIGPLLLNWIFGQMNNPAGTALQIGIFNMIRSLVNSYTSELIKFSATYTVIGLALLLSLWYQARTRKSVHPTEAGPPTQAQFPTASTSTEDKKFQ